jgi:hypothetical protein
MRIAVLSVPLIALCASCSQAAPTLTLAADGKSDYTVLVARDATVAEKHAAEEFVSLFQQVTGVRLPVRNSSKPPKRPAVVVGPNDAIKSLAPDLSLDGLGADGFVIETRGPNLILAGGRPRGTLYAVYTFFEDTVGCRWWASTVSTIPKKLTLTVPELHDRQVPVLEYREPFWADAFDGDWAVRNKANGASERLSEAQGGKISYKGFVHTFYSLVPPDPYFRLHPEWYSEIGGKRTFEGAQLCLTNQELKDFVVERVKQWLRESPEASIVSVSQNDCGGACQCANCQALAQEEESEAGPLLHFVNYVAEKIEPEFPNVAVDTLAYQYTRKPPLHVRPRPNVIVRLCSIECDFARPLGESDTNRTFREDIEGWSKICNRLYIWDYTTNFSHYFAPHPNYYALGPNVKFFVDHGVKGIFEQGAYTSVGAEMAELRAWVLAKLLWNPDRDPQALINEFLAGYFEEAAPAIKQYMDLVYGECIKTNHYLGCFSQVNAPFLNLDVLLQSEKLFDQAEAAVADKPDVLFRVKVARLPIMYVKAVRWYEFGEEARRRGMDWPGVDGYNRLCQDFLHIAKQRGVTMISEGRNLDAFEARTVSLWRRQAPPPPGCEGLAEDSYMDLQDSAFRLALEGTWASLRHDDLASDGVAARMPGDHYEWAVQQGLGVRIVTENPGVPLRVFASIRVEKTGEEGAAFDAGVYDTESKTGVGGVRVQANEVQDDQYHSYEIVNAPLTGSMYVWVAPTKNPENVKAVWVDRIWIVKQ